MDILLVVAYICVYISTYLRSIRTSLSAIDSLIDSTVYLLVVRFTDWLDVRTQCATMMDDPCVMNASSYIGCFNSMFPPNSTADAVLARMLGPCPVDTEGVPVQSSSGKSASVVVCGIVGGVLGGTYDRGYLRTYICNSCTHARTHARVPGYQNDSKG
jgi:hypothetical protein